MEQNICKNCGSLVPDRAHVCPRCGWQLTIGYTEEQEEPLIPMVKTAERPEAVDRLRPLLDRGEIALEEGEWEEADRFFEEVLSQDSRCAEAYLGKLLVELKISSLQELKNCDRSFGDNKYYGRALRFGDEEMKRLLQTASESVRRGTLYREAKEAMAVSRTKDAYLRAAALFEQISDYRDAQNQAEQCRQKAEEAEQTRLEGIYREAMSAYVKKNYIAAAQKFDSISFYQDAEAMAEKCRDEMRNYQKELEAQRLKERQRAAAQQKKRRCAIAGGLAGLVVILLLVYFWIIPASQYRDAEILLENGKYLEAAIAFGSLDDYSDARERTREIWDQIAVRETISTGWRHTVGLKADGTVVAVGGNDDGMCDVDGWNDIVAISAGLRHTVGLKTDGTVVAVGGNDDGQCSVEGWTDIVAISTGAHHTVGLKTDGTVVAVGWNFHNQCDVEDWIDIIAISTGDHHIVGLKTDGTVVAVGRNDDGQCDVAGWSDIVAISAGIGHTVGLKADGTVVAVGANNLGQCDVEDWTDIVAVSAGTVHTVGLKADGTVVAVGDKSEGQCDVAGWTDIVAINAGCYHTVGLKADGTVVAVGSNDFGQCDVDDWRDIRVPENKLP